MTLLKDEINSFQWEEKPWGYDEWYDQTKEQRDLFDILNKEQEKKEEKFYDLNNNSNDRW
jgi:hypothetical protein